MRGNVNRWFRILLVAGTALVAVAAGWAFSLITDSSKIYAVNWQPGTINIRIMLPAPTVTTVDGTDLNTSFQAAIDGWNARLGVFQMTGQALPPGSRAAGNRINEVVMAAAANGSTFDTSTLAVTLSFARANTRTESDIVFNSALTWDSYRGPRAGNGGRHDLRRIAYHELGHLLGLDHPDQATPPQAVPAVMYSRVSDVDGLLPDDIAGGQALYGAPGVIPANDNFANATAIVLNSASTKAYGTTVACTKEPGEPAHATSPTVMTSWWKWTAPSAGSTTITTLGSSFDSVLGVYTGTAVNALTQVAANDDVQPGVIRTSTVTFPAAAGTTYYIAVGGWDEFYGVVTLNLSFGGVVPTQPPAITVHPKSVSLVQGNSYTFGVSAGGSGVLTYQWLYNGVVIPNATLAVYTIPLIAPRHAGLYSVRVSDANGTSTSNPGILGVLAFGKLAGSASEVGFDIVHPNGNIYDQVLLQGSSASVTADAGQIVRTSYIDLSDDIVQVEFSGEGTLSIVLANPTGPAVPANYNQNVTYMKGHATIVVSGADESTNLLIFSVGRFTALNQALFRDEVVYDGFADIASVSIFSTNGKFGGLRASNTSFFANEGLTGIYAPGVEFVGPVFVGDITAVDNARPVLLLGSASDVRVTGGDLLQGNDQAVAVSGITRLQFTAGQTSHATMLPAQANRARLEQNGVDVTATLVVPAGP